MDKDTAELIGYTVSGIVLFLGRRFLPAKEEIGTLTDRMAKDARFSNRTNMLWRWHALSLFEIPGGETWFPRSTTL